MENKKIYTCNLMGGLGNQLFQISNALSKSLENGASLLLRRHSQTQLQGNDTSKYIDNVYKKINFSDLILTELNITEKEWSYNTIKIPKDKSIQFTGYYQSSLNFKKHKQEVIECFSPSLEFKKSMIKKYKKLSNENNISIHVRRGDYLNFQNIHPVISKSYITECLNRISKYDHIFIFTDDKEWVNNNLFFENSTLVSEDDWVEMWIMSMCRINIISNSSFSWWGSYLNQNPNKEVYSPSIWFGENGPKNYTDIFEPEFNIINCKLLNGEIIYEKD